jgi:hypothetical protein
MQVIGIAGQLGNGKDVLADYLVERLNSVDPGWNRSAFANAVKDIFCSSFGVDRQFIEDWKRNPEPPEGFLKNIRQSLQFIGDGFRQIRGNIWIEIALRDESKKLIISDSRYINEAKAVRAKGGVMVVLYRPGFMNDDPNPSEAQIKPIVEWCNNHLEDGPIFSQVGSDFPSDLQYYDLFIRNDGTIEQMYEKIDRIVVPYLKEKFSRV